METKAETDFIAEAKRILDSGDDGARKHMLDTTRKAMALLETPLETVWNTIMSPHAPAALMTLIKAGVIQRIAASDSPTSAEELATATKANKLLIVRLLRPLSALGFVKETGLEEYAPTPITKALMDRALLGGYQFMFSAATRSLANMPFYLEKTGFKNVEGAPGPFQDAHHTQDNMFSWLTKDPPMMGNFNAFMTGQRADRKQWFDFYDVDNNLLEGAKTDSDATLLIDIAGGEGHDIAEFHRRYPDSPAGSFCRIWILFFRLSKSFLRRSSGLLSRIANITSNIGARCYYFRSIFHDWPDADCVKILKRTAAAMTPGYSKLLMSEWVLPAQNTPLYPALLDINMMAVLNGMERTEAQFTKLLDDAGLKVVKFWYDAAHVEGLVEAVLKD
ncbi:S-adenosyl-L-methionine-dependent methyltransferase [Xylariaceae sp. FL0594]|nr:S-adenosyl-L-methionine-dependent methyltransferase [Xylariaceae sp. FL0594]